MALVKFGGGVVQMLGSIAGNVFSRNSSGNIVRAKTKPVQPNTERQNVAKAIFSVINALWSNGGLTEVQREAWRTYAKNVPWTNRLGETITLNGNSMFGRSNVARETATLTRVLPAPTNFTLVGADETFVGVVDAAGQEISVTFDDTRDYIDTDGAGMSVFMGMPQNPGVDSFDGPWRYAGVILGDGTTPLTSPQTMAVPFPVVEGQKVWLKAQIMEADGRMSRPFRNVSSVVA